MKNENLTKTFRYLIAGLAICCVPGAFADSLLIENVTLIDGTGRPPMVAASVLVEGDRIQLISDEPINPPANTQRIDGTGQYLIPGLMDMHIHLTGGADVTPEGLTVTTMDRTRGVRALHSYLYTGVTSVYDAGNVPDYILGLRDDERSGKLVAPRIFATGGIVTYPDRKSVV